MMATALAPATTNTLPGHLREDGYDLPPDLPWERWLSIGETLQQMQRSINWWVGDWLRYGEAYWGETAYQAVKDMTGRGDESLGQATWVAARFPASTRVPELSWSHHRAVLLDDLPMEDAHALLREAVAEHLPVRDLVSRARQRKETIRAEAMVGTSTCAADAPWRPSLSDLLPEWRVRAEQSGQPQGYLAALVDTQQEACFLEWRD